MQIVIPSVLLFASTAYIFYMVFYVNYKLARRYGRSYKSDMPHSHMRGVFRLFIPSMAMALGLTMLIEGNIVTFIILTLILALIFLAWGYLTFKAMLRFIYPD